MIARLVIRFSAVGLVLGHSVWLMATGHMFFGVIEHTLLVAALLWGTLNPNSRLFGPIQSKLDEGVALTIDDGPDPHDTPILLDLLDKYDAKATFFLIGRKAEEHPHLVREIQARGHQIGNHTWSHPQATFWCASPWRLMREIKKCQETLTTITGQSPTLFRAPVGHSNLFVHPILKHLRLRLIGWNCRGYDAADRSIESVLESISRGLDEGAIILAHEATTITEPVIVGIIREVSDRGHDLVATIR